MQSSLQFSEVCIENEKGRGSSLIPGLGYDDITLSQDLKSYKPRAWRMLFHIDHSKERLIQDGYLDLRKLEQTHFTYIICGSCRRLVPYERMESKGMQPYAFPMNIVTQLGPVGKSSFQLESKVMDMDNQELFMYTVSYVCVDRKTLKVDPHPSWWLEGMLKERFQQIAYALILWFLPILLSLIQSWLVI